MDEIDRFNRSARDTRAAPAPGNPICGGISRLGVSLSIYLSALSM
jgi:hypothetical protein